MQFLCCGFVDKLIGTLGTDCYNLNNVVVAWQPQSQLALRQMPNLLTGLKFLKTGGIPSFFSSGPTRAHFQVRENIQNQAKD